jgi:hypothetical protein
MRDFRPERQRRALLRKRMLAKCPSLYSASCFSPISVSDNIVIDSSDHGTYRVKDVLLAEVNGSKLNLQIPSPPPISFISTDTAIFQTVEVRLIAPTMIEMLRNHTKERSLMYLEYFEGGNTTLHNHLVDLSNFISICNNHTKYRIIF